MSKRKVLVPRLPFQITGIWRMTDRHNGRCLNGDDMGLGKSMQSAHAAEPYRHGSPAIVICPNPVKYGWRDEIKKHLGLDSYVCNGRTPPATLPKKMPPYIIINWEILEGWVEALKKFAPNVIIPDECFPYETKVLTERGQLPIGFICENQLKIKVASVCKDGTIEYQPITHHFQLARKTRLVKIKFNNDMELVCTENHQVWTSEGYKNAIELISGTRVRMVWGNFSYKEGNNQKILQHELLSKMENERPGNAQNLLHQGKTHSSKKRPSRVLEKRTRQKAKKKEQTTNASTQSFTQSKSSGACVAFQNAQRDTRRVEIKSGRQRKSKQTAKKVTQTSRTELERRICGENTRTSISPTLQNRHSESQTQNRRGVGRIFSYLEGAKTTGQKKEQITKEIRVESVEILKSDIRSNPKTCNSQNQTSQTKTVYCIEVNKNHNFFADKILVSNCQYAKNLQAKRTKALVRLCNGVPYIYPLSGTPIENGPMEFYPILHLLWPLEFPSKKEFGTRYTNPIFTPWGIQYKGAQRMKELNLRLKQFGWVRRLRTDVLKQLPPIQRTTVEVNLKNFRKYKAAETNFVKWLHKHKPTKARRLTKSAAFAMVRLNYLLQLAAELKMNHVFEWIDNFLETSNEKLCVYGHNRDFLEQIHKRYKGKSVLYYGGMSHKKREHAKGTFVKDPKCRLFIGSILAAGTGINGLQHVCSKILIAQLYWVGVKLLQLEGRLWRIGQTNPVTAYYMIAQDTVELIMAQAIWSKQGMLNKILDGKFGKQQEFSVLERVFKRLYRKKGR